MSNEVKFWHKGEFYFVALLFIITLYFVIESWGFPRLAKIFPLVVGITALLIVTADVVQTMAPKIGNKFQGFKGGELFKTKKEEELTRALKEAGKGDTVEEEGGETVKESEASLTIKTFLWFMGAFVTFYLFGYLVFCAAFLFLYLRFYARLSFMRSSAITAGFTLFVWIAFSEFLKLRIFAGSVLF